MFYSSDASPEHRRYPIEAFTLAALSGARYPVVGQNIVEQSRLYIGYYPNASKSMDVLLSGSK